MTYCSGTKTMTILFGGANDDNLFGGANDDLLDGGAGDDTLFGGAGIDTLRGGAGNDVLRFENAGDIIQESAGEGTADRVLASVSFVLAAGVEVEQLQTSSTSGTVRST